MALNSAFRTLSVVLVLMLALTGKAMSQSVLIPSPPQIAGSSYVLMDPKSGRMVGPKQSGIANPNQSRWGTRGRTDR